MVAGAGADVLVQPNRHGLELGKDLRVDTFFDFAELGVQQFDGYR